MQTGLTLYRYFQQKVGADYTGFLDTAKANRLFKDATISLIERIYSADYDQKQWDEITTVTKTQYVIPVVDNYLQTAPIQITNITQALLVVTVTTAIPHGLVAGDVVVLQDVAGITSTPAINGSSFTVTAVTSNTIKFVVTAFAGAYTAGTGEVTSPSFLNDYWHLLSIKLKYIANIYDLKVAGASNETPIKITLDYRNNIRTGELITIGGIIGNTNANGTFYVKSLNNFKLALYADEDFQVPVAGNGAYVSGGSLSRISYTYATPYTPAAKISVLMTPDQFAPTFEIAENQIKFYPRDKTCMEATVDYITQPSVLIDVSNNTIDLTNYYPEKFLLAIVNEAAVVFGILTRDTELIQTESMEQSKNP